MTTNDSPEEIHDGVLCWWYDGTREWMPYSASELTRLLTIERNAREELSALLREQVLAVSGLTA